jgi:hypothetical protein
VRSFRFVSKIGCSWMAASGAKRTLATVANSQNAWCRMRGYETTAHGAKRPFVVWDEPASEGLPWPVKQHICNTTDLSY